MNGLSLYVTGKKIVLGMVDEDDWEYAKLNFDGSNLRVLTSTTHEDGHNYGTAREGEMTVHYIGDFKDDEKLTKVASRDSINSLWIAVEEAVSEMLGEAKGSARLLSEFSDIQSESIHKDLSDLMNGNYFEKQWVKARLAIDTDASDSLTRTTQFLESVCRHYLEKRKIPLGNKKTITDFINAVVADFPPLKFPNGEDHTADIKAFFGGVKGISQSAGALRTHLGTAHGGDKTANADEARLSNNLAGAVAIYILEKLKDLMVSENE
ncbi:abortive infection family protein [Pseudomonas sp. IPO3774]|nr:abortive infection family protein [Pseudomonas sp. IPO3774]